MNTTPPKTEPKRKKLNSRWRKGAQRYSGDRTVERVVYAGKKRIRETERTTELAFVANLSAQPGWRKGAKIRKR